MNIISKSEFNKLISKDPEHCFCIRSEQGVLTLLSEIEITEDHYAYHEMSFGLRWKTADSIIQEINDVRSRHVGGIYITDCDTASEAISEFTANTGDFTKFLSVDDTEFETIARSYPNDLLYIHVTPVEQESKRKTRKLRKKKTDIENSDISNDIDNDSNDSNDIDTENET